MFWLPSNDISLINFHLLNDGSLQLKLISKSTNCLHFLGRFVLQKSCITAGTFLLVTPRSGKGRMGEGEDAKGICPLQKVCQQLLLTYVISCSRAIFTDEKLVDPKCSFEPKMTLLWYQIPSEDNQSQKKNCSKPNSPPPPHVTLPSVWNCSNNGLRFSSYDSYF